MLVTVLSLAIPSAAPVSAAPPAASPLAKYKPTDSEALAHFTAGNRYYRAGSDSARPLADRVRDLEHAIAEYTAGIARENAPAFDYNLGHAFKALGRNADAIEHLQRFLERAQPGDDVRRAIEDDVAELDPTGDLRAELARKKAAATAPAPPVQTPEVSHATAAPAPPPAPVAPPPREVRHWDRVGWTLTGAGVVGAGVAAGFLINAASIDSDAADPQAHPDASLRQQLKDRASSRRRTGVITGIGGGVLLVAGIVKLTLLSGDDASATRTSWNLGITGDGVAVFGRF